MVWRDEYDEKVSLNYVCSQMGKNESIWKSVKWNRVDCLDVLQLAILKSQTRKKKLILFLDLP